ncbi:hypothetical protein N0V82_010087 [Gnomoniopsis sp. IMI 355080]|nr:hypothetical protein N0V82_010087 [Gnomoniopsis sp. IMI 355080]
MKVPQALLIGPDSTVGFSHCGTAIAISHTGRPWPQLLALSSVLPQVSCLQSSTRKRAIGDAGDISQPTKRPHLVQPKDVESNNDRSVAWALTQIPPVLSTSSVVSLQGQASGANGNVAIVSSKSHPNEIKVLYGNGNAANELSICKLPSYIPLESASINIAMRPSSSADGRPVCTTVVNAGPVSVYESDVRGAAQHLPVVMWKDSAALRVDRWSGHLLEADENSIPGDGEVRLVCDKSVFIP